LSCNVFFLSTSKKKNAADKQGTHFFIHKIWLLVWAFKRVRKRANACAGETAGKGRPLSDDEGDSTASTSAGRYKNDSDGDDVGPRVPKRARHEDDDDDDDEDGDDHRRGSAAPAAPAAKAATAAGPVYAKQFPSPHITDVWF